MREKIASSDVTFDELCSLIEKEGSVSKFLAFLMGELVKDVDRMDSVSVGSIDIEVDEDGFLHLDFINRFKVRQA